MTCVACEGSGKNSRGFPCPICAGVGNPHLCARPLKTKTRAESLMEELLGMARLMGAKASQEPPEPTAEQLAEQERRSKAQALLRQMRELLD